jgi:hypothetical protein
VDGSGLEAVYQPCEKPGMLSRSKRMAEGVNDADGDTWKHCFVLKERPTEFGSKEESEAYYIVLKRVKNSNWPRS